MGQWSTGIYVKHGKGEAFTEGGHAKVHAKHLQEL
jgi:hypothetical protein